MEDGLPASHVPALCQTGDGYLWIGTASGLARFDGRRFAVFNAENTQALRETGEDVRAVEGLASLALDREGNLWCGTRDRGLLRLCPRRLLPLALDAPRRFRHVRSVAEGPNGTIWCGTLAGVVEWSGARVRVFDYLPNLSQEGDTTGVFSLGRALDGAIWAGFRSAGIIQLAPATDDGVGTWMPVGARRGD